MTVDKDWFVREIEDKCGSMRSFAKRMDLDVSAVSRMLSGQRKIQLAEAASMSIILAVPVEEIMTRAGLMPQKRRPR
jgi:hypothetical protein